MTLRWAAAIAIVLPIWILAVIAFATKEYKPMSSFVKDLLERSVKTFVQAFLATWGGGSVLEWHFSVFRSAALAGIAAVVSMLTSVLSSRIGNKTSASLVQ